MDTGVTFHWSIDLGTVATLSISLVGFIVLIARSRSDLDNLKRLTSKLVEEVDDMKLKLATLEERVANWTVQRMHRQRD